MITINSIEFNHYRQYKKFSINFTRKAENNINIIKAKNGTGKTTFLNGILWCLYGKEYYISDTSKALDIMNETTRRTAKPNDNIEVKVKVKIETDESYITFERERKYQVSIDLINDKKSVVPITPTSIFKVIETPKNSGNSKVYESFEETQSIVKQYFNEDIYTYYFFDGENLKNYFDKKNSGKVKDSIFSLSQVNLLSKSINNTRTLSEEKRRAAEKLGPIDKLALYDEKDNLEDKIKKYKKENEDIESEIPSLKYTKDEIDNRLLNYKPVRDKQARRTELERKLYKLKNDKSELISRKKEFIRTYIILFKLFPYIKKTYKMIDYKQKHGELPPKIDKQQIELLLKDPNCNCPVCDNRLNEHAVNHMKKLIEDLAVSSHTANYLSGIKGGLENAIFKCKKYSNERTYIIEKEKKLNLDILNTERELNDISKFLTDFEGKDISNASISELEEKRRNIEDQLTIKFERKSSNNAMIKIHEGELDKIILEIDKYEEKIKDHDIFLQECKILRKLNSNFDIVKTNLMNEIKKEIEIKTWDLFENMIWKKSTFNSIEINDNYQMTVYNNNKNDMTGSMSATEHMALAYSFTLAIHETSGQNCPLVVDSPLGRVSDENRKNMANELLKISKNKQIIMLFTPDEYSKEVSDVYEGKVASNRYIELSEDESEVLSKEI